MSEAKELAIDGSNDVVSVRHEVRSAAVRAGLSLVDQTKIVTAASELARNVVTYAGKGRVRLEFVRDGRRLGLRLTFTDEGPGIPNVERVLATGWSTSGGLGLGLTGTRRLVDEFDLVSAPGRGTRVTVTKWAI